MSCKLKPVFRSLLTCLYFISTYIHSHRYTYIYIHIRTYTYIYIHIHTYTYIYIHIHTYTSIYIHIHTYTYIYIHIHTYTYIYIRTVSPDPACLEQKRVCVEHATSFGPEPSQVFRRRQICTSHVLRCHVLAQDMGEALKLSRRSHSVKGTGPLPDGEKSFRRLQKHRQPHIGRHQALRVALPELVTHAL